MEESHPGMSETGIKTLHFQFALMQTGCWEFISPPISRFDAEPSSSGSSLSWTSAGSARYLCRHASSQHVSNRSAAADAFHELDFFPPHFLLASNRPECSAGERGELCLRMPMASVGALWPRTHLRPDDISHLMQTKPTACN